MLIIIGCWLLPQIDSTLAIERCCCEALPRSHILCCRLYLDTCMKECAPVAMFHRFSMTSLRAPMYSAALPGSAWPTSRHAIGSGQQWLLCQGARPVRVCSNEANGAILLSVSHANNSKMTNCRHS